MRRIATSTLLIGLILMVLNIQILSLSPMITLK